MTRSTTLKAIAGLLLLALLLLTLRHRIARTGANTLEGYMHPRQLAFAIGVAAWVCFLRGRTAWAVAATPPDPVAAALCAVIASKVSRSWVA